MPCSAACSSTHLGLRRRPRSSGRTVRRRGAGSGPTGPRVTTSIGDAARLPISYATITASGQSTWTWAASTTDPRALQNPGGHGRIAAGWYASNGFTVGVDLTDGRVHDLELYFLDWDGSGRSERVQISNAVTGAVLDTETVASFNAGAYLEWAVSGGRLDHDHEDGRGQCRAQRPVPRPRLDSDGGHRIRRQDDAN